jgi:hypothetical protein
MICQGWRADLFPTDFVIPEISEPAELCTRISVILAVSPVGEFSSRQTRAPPQTSFSA